MSDRAVWLEQRCPERGAAPALWELVRRSAVWEELDRRRAMTAVVAFWGRAGAGGRPDTIKLWRLGGKGLVEVDRWTHRNELWHALEASVWDRYGGFAGHPLIRAELIWTADDRCLVVRGRRGRQAFEELAG
jgi:hypothetical protein